MTGETLKQEESPQPCPANETYDLEVRVRTLLKEKQGKMSDLCRYVGMTEAGMRRMFANHSCTTTTLMKIADFLDLPVSRLLPFDSCAAEEEAKAMQIQFLKGQLDVYRNLLSRVGH